MAGLQPHYYSQRDGTKPLHHVVTRSLSQTGSYVVVDSFLRDAEGNARPGPLLANMRREFETLMRGGATSAAVPVASHDQTLGHFSPAHLSGDAGYWSTKMDARRRGDFVAWLSLEALRGCPATDAESAARGALLNGSPLSPEQRCKGFPATATYVHECCNLVEAMFQAKRSSPVLTSDNQTAFRFAETKQCDVSRSPQPSVVPHERCETFCRSGASPQRYVYSDGVAYCGARAAEGRSGLAHERPPQCSSTPQIDGDNDVPFLTLDRVMLAAFPYTGSRFVAHVDNPNNNGRVLTFTFYLNEPISDDDQEEANDAVADAAPAALVDSRYRGMRTDGGCLRIVPLNIRRPIHTASDDVPTGPKRLCWPSAPICVKSGRVMSTHGAEDTTTAGGSDLIVGFMGNSTLVAPIANRLVIFYADARAPHEVLPFGHAQSETFVRSVNEAEGRSHDKRFSTVAEPSEKKPADVVPEPSSSDRRYRLSITMWFSYSSPADVAHDRATALEMWRRRLTKS